MKKYILLCFLFTLLSKFSTACVCPPPNIFLEYHISKYVFYGEIISKTYPKDSLTYTFTFKIEEHFKELNKPEYLSFTWPSEARYRKEGISSCDYDVNIGNKLLVFAQEKNGKLSFGLNCSNSSFYGMSVSNISALKAAKNFNIYNYHFNFNNTLFNDAKPITNIDSLTLPLKNKDYGNFVGGVIIMFDVDTNGNVIKSNFWETTNSEFNKIDPEIYVYDIINKEYRKPENEFEVDALEVSKSIKNWEVLRFLNGNMPVNSRHYIIYKIDKNHKLSWKQFYFML